MRKKKKKKENKTLCTIQFTQQGNTPKRFPTRPIQPIATFACPKKMKTSHYKFLLINKKENIIQKQLSSAAKHNLNLSSTQLAPLKALNSLTNHSKIPISF